jgi:F420-dependent oxidoreductase-like protein
MSAAGLDQLCGGRFNLGLGASGPQVIEGLHGVPYEKPMRRIEETIEICRELWRREEALMHHGTVFEIPLAAGRGTGLGKPLRLINHPKRADIPVYWAALRDRSVESAAAIADGWLPTLFVPEHVPTVFGPSLRAGQQRRPTTMAPLQIVAGGRLAIGDDLDVEALLDLGRPQAALYIGGMGARGHNFYNELVCRYGYEGEAKVIQDLYLDGHKHEAEAAVPHELLQLTSLIGPASWVAERIAAYADAGVTALDVDPVGPDPIGSLRAVRELVEHPTG